MIGKSGTRVVATLLLVVAGLGAGAGISANAPSAHAARMHPAGLGMGLCPPHPVNGCLVVPPGSHGGGA